MKGYIKNSDQLLSHGNRKLRNMGIQLIEAALKSSNPYEATKKLVHLSGDKLDVGPHTYDLSMRGNIYVLGAGKATFPIAKALEEILGDRITEGLVVLKKGQNEKLDRINIVEASHPIPNGQGLRAAKRMMTLAAEVQEDDIVFACITGGSSSLLPMPVESITLREKKRVNQLLLSCGASITEINCVRKHISKIKGGQLALAIFPGEIINLTVSDVINDPLDYITDPTVPDTSTFDDAMKVLRKYSLLEKVPLSIRTYLETATPKCETPKDFGTMRYHNFILANNDSACNAAAIAAESQGLKPVILSTMFEGESRETGRVFAAIAKEVRRSRKLIEPPCVLIGGGETIVTLGNNFGRGGPNQEFVVSAVLSLEGQENFLVGGLDTDGNDGPTNVAGAVADDTTLLSARNSGLELQQSLTNHTVVDSLIHLDDVIVTGSTGTNVNDLKFLILT